MIGPIYDYDKQRWTKIDTLTDKLLTKAITTHDGGNGVERRITFDGVEYEYKFISGEYRNV